MTDINITNRPYLKFKIALFVLTLHCKIILRHMHLLRDTPNPDAKWEGLNERGLTLIQNY